MAKKSHIPSIPPVSRSARESEIVATYLIKNPKEVAVFLKEKKWAEVACLADYMAAGVPLVLAKTDQALFRVLSSGVAEIHIMGFGWMSGNALRALAATKFGTKSLARRK